MPSEVLQPRSPYGYPSSHDSSHTRPYFIDPSSTVSHDVRQVDALGRQVGRQAGRGFGEVKNKSWINMIYRVRYGNESAIEHQQNNQEPRGCSDTRAVALEGWRKGLIRMCHVGARTTENPLAIQSHETTTQLLSSKITWDKATSEKKTKSTAVLLLPAPACYHSQIRSP